MELGVGISLVILVATFVKIIADEVRACRTPRGRQNCARRQKEMKELEDNYGIIEICKK